MSLTAIFSIVCAILYSFLAAITWAMAAWKRIKYVDIAGQRHSVDWSFCSYAIYLYALTTPASVAMIAMSGAARQYVVNAFWPSPLLFYSVTGIIFGGLIGPIVEEYLFRGLLPELFGGKERMMRACITSSILFACLNPGAFIIGFYEGIILCIIRWRSESIFTAIMIRCIMYMLSSIVYYMTLYSDISGSLIQWVLFFIGCVSVYPISKAILFISSDAPIIQGIQQHDADLVDLGSKGVDNHRRH